MAGEDQQKLDQQIQVNDIAHDNYKLIARLKDKINEDTYLDDDETHGGGRNAVFVDSSVRAILVQRRNTREGSIRIDGGSRNTPLYVQQGPSEEDDYTIVTIEPGQLGILLGNISVRYFHPAS